MRIDDYDVFLDRFQPIETNNGIFVNFDDTRLKEVGPEFVWTLLDCDGKLYLAPGKHWVNRVEYILCNKPWKEGQRDYFYC